MLPLESEVMRGLGSIPTGGNIFTARKQSLGQGNIFSSVCQEFCSREGLSACWDTTPPRPGTPPPKTRHPPGTRHPSPAQCMLGVTVNKRAVCILLECNLVHWIFLFSRSKASAANIGIIAILVHFEKL